MRVRVLVGAALIAVGALEVWIAYHLLIAPLP